MTRWVSALVLVVAGGCSATAPPAEKTEEPAAPAAELAAPRVTEEFAEVGRVQLKWVAGEGGPAPEFYEVFRCDPRGEWTKVWTTKSLEFDDLAVDGRTTYVYKVRACAGHPGSRVESPFSHVICVETPCAVELAYLGGSPQAAVITVRKRIRGEWRERRFTVMPRNDERGQTGEIGRMDAREDLDFRTGFVLTAISREPFKFKRKERRSRIVNGVLETEDVEVEAQRDRFRITYTDDEGASCQLWVADEPEGRK